jgi:release factor glutamine methyltransferase
MATVDSLLADARPRLTTAPFKPPRREAILLLGHALGLSEAQVLARGGDEVPAAAAERFTELLNRRLTGEPVAYLLGEKEFYGRPFWVDGRVLIPRPETEHVAAAALELPLPPTPRILDIGTGSGCLAVTLALELPQARVVAADISPGAVAVARRNARRHRVDGRVAFAAADLDQGIDLGRFDLVVSNPPYVDEAVEPWLSTEVRDFEPHVALFAAARGDAVLLRLFQAARRLRAGSWLLLEMGSGQFESLEPHLQTETLELREVRPDYAGIPRVLVFRRRADEPAMP